MNPMLIQKQVRENAEDLHNYMLDLKSWESDMKRKENELKHAESESFSSQRPGLEQLGDLGLPPVRSKMSKTKKRIKPDTVAQSTETGEKPKKITGFDYASWDRFDVDKACEEIDEDAEESEEETDSEEEIENEERLREEALYEKEKGNQFVKNKKWTEAIQCYSRAIECFPHDAIYHANRALCYLKTNNLESAETDCTTSLKLDGDYVKAYQRRAVARAGLGRLLEAQADLETVLELEPMNTASKAELIKLVKVINSSTPKKLVVTPSGEHSEILPRDQKNEVGSREAARKEEVGSGEAVDVRTSWGSDDGVELVRPINKPPHLRSKKPLKRIAIQEIGGDLGTLRSTGMKLGDMNVEPVNENSDRVQRSTAAVQSQLVDEKRSVASSQAEQVTGLGQAVEGSHQSKESEEQVPGRPRSSVEFLVGWKKVRSSPRLAFVYLKQIPGADIPKIFQESFESATFTEIISTLETQFLINEVPIYSYLLGMSNVRRLSALTMFMSSADKAGLNKLLESCVAHAECNNDEAKILRYKFEL